MRILIFFIFLVASFSLSFACSIDSVQKYYPDMKVGTQKGEDNFVNVGYYQPTYDGKGNIVDVFVPVCRLDNSVPVEPKKCLVMSDSYKKCSDNLLEKSTSQAFDKWGSDYQCGHKFTGDTYTLACSRVYENGDMSYTSFGGTCKISYEESECENQEEPEPPEEPEKPDVPCLTNLESCDIPPDLPEPKDPIKDPNGEDSGTGGDNGSGNGNDNGECIGNNCENNNGKGLTKSDVTQAIKDADILGCNGNSCIAGDFSALGGDAGFADIPKTFWESRYESHDLMKLYEEKIESTGNSIVSQIRNINTDLGEGTCPVIELPEEFGSFQFDCDFLQLIRAAFLFSATLTAFFIVFRR